MLVIKAGHMFDGTSSQIKHKQAILIEGERITKVCPLDQLEIPEQAAVIDHLEGYVLPGLIDCHVHLTCSAIADSRLEAGDSEATFAFRAVANAQKTLKAGFTTVRSLGSHFDVDIELRKALEEGLVTGPRLLASGRVISITGGHGHETGIEADGPWEVRKAVRSILKAGADVIKVMSTGGVLTEGVEPGISEFSLEELQAAAAEAHRTGARIATHAQGNTGIRNAVQAGIDTIEHGIYLDDLIIELMLKKGAFLVPTLSAPHNINVHGAEAGIPAYAVEKSQRIAKAHVQSFRKAYKAGIVIGLGTDAGTPFNHHGENAQELVLMTEAGMSPVDALKAATSGASRVLGLEDRLGQIAEGYLADLLLIKGNPLENIGLLRDVQNIAHVFLGGKRVV